MEKNTKNESITTFDLVFDHEDVIAMMNDADVYFQDGAVSETQVIDVIVTNTIGTEYHTFHDLSPGGQLILRFTAVAKTDESTSLGGVDVEPAT